MSFTPPDNLFCLIERAITKNPARLNMDHYHTLPSGDEALSPDQILHPLCQHDLAGWIVACTPNAARSEGCRIDVDDYAVSILKAGHYPPIPWGILFGDREDAWRTIRGRAAEERSMN